jgi:molybdopterin synthase sulfur carrier subunit
MPVRVSIPTNLRKLTRGQHTVELEARNLREAIEELDRLYPGIRERLIDVEGKLKRHVNIYRNGRDIREEGGLKTTLDDGDTISIVPVLAGG